MCGRYALFDDLQAVSDMFGFDAALVADTYAPTWNAAPTGLALTVRAAAGRREAAMRRWGFAPHWAKGGVAAKPMINARSETAAELPTFRDAFKRRRCLIPASGFYEWAAASGGKAKTPMWIRRADGAPFAFAGVWIPAGGNEGGGGSCAILTTRANAQMQAIHSRMPVIVAADDCDDWLDPDAPSDVLAAICAPRDWDGVVAAPVGPAVNSARNDGPRLIEPAPAAPRMLI